MKTKADTNTPITKGLAKRVFICNLALRMYLERFRDANRFRFLPRASVSVRKAAIRQPCSWVFSEKRFAFRGDAGADGGFWGFEFRWLR
jgi:hypothetical protein